MKKFLKYFGFTVLGIVGIVYLAFLFVLPNVVDLNQFKPMVQEIAKEQAKLDVDFQDAKIVTTPLLGAGIKTGNITVKLPDKSVLFSADGVKARISLPSLFLLTVKVSCFEVDKPFVNLEIVNDENFKVVKLVEDILNSGKEQKLEEPVKEEETVTEEQGFQFNPEWIRIKVPNIQLNDYKILVNDLKNKHYLDLHGEKLQLGYFNGKAAKFKTYAELYSDDKKNITANIDIKTFLPKIEPALDEEDDPAERIKIPFINPVTMYRNYDLKANLDTKLRIKENDGQIRSRGYFNIDGITLKVSQLQLPESYMHIKTAGTKVDMDTDIYVTKGQNIQLLGNLNYGNNPKMDMSVKTGKIQFNDLVILGKAFLDSLSIRNELNLIKAEGYLQSDCYIKTNFKKLISNGTLTVKNGGVSVRNLGKVLSQANINVILDNNVLNIKDSSLLVSGAKVFVNGKIDEKSMTDVKVKADKIPLPKLFYAFAPKEVRNAFNFRSADASLDMAVNGEMKEAQATAKFALDNLDFADRANSFNIKNKKFTGDFTVDAKNVVGSLVNKDFAILLPATRSAVTVPALDVQVADKNVIIKENVINFNKNSHLTYSGEILNYEKLDSIKMLVQGNVASDDVINLIGKELKMYFHSQGSLPVKLTVDGNAKKQTLYVHALGNKDNFITPVDFTDLIGKDTSLQSVVDFKGNRIKIKKTGLYTRAITVDEEGNEQVHLSEILGVDGTIAGNTINLIKITMPKALQGKIHVFPQSSFKLDGKAFVFGETSAPRFRGGFTLSDLSIPELLLKLANADLRFKGHDANFTVQNLGLNGSDLQIEGVMSLLPSSVLNISNLNIASKLINVDKLMVIADKAMKYVPPTPAGANVSSQSADIPVRIKNGTIRMAHIVTGNINVRNTVSRIMLDRNIFYLRRLHTDVFKGHVRGNIAVNLVTSLLDIRVRGRGIDVDQALVDAAAMKDTLSGEADFTANISLKGATYEEQMESLKGGVTFSVKDGQFGPFGKLENMILAENIRESQFFQTALGGVIESLFTIDTTHFSELKGVMSFENGIVHINPITSLGNVLSLHIAGDFDLLKNEVDMKVRARMASLISNLLGPIAAINPANLLNSAASLNVVTAKAFSIFCEMVPQEEIDALPSFSNSYVDNAAMKFQIVVRGDVAKPLRLVKSFKWLATTGEYENAQNFVSALPDPVEGSTATNIEEAIAEAQALEAEKKTLKYKFKHIFDKKEKASKTVEIKETVVEDVKTEVVQKIESQSEQLVETAKQVVEDVKPE